MLKYKTLLVMLCLSNTMILHAQSYKFETGAEGGASLSFLRNNDYLNQFTKKQLIAPCYGLFLQYNFTNHLALRTNLFSEQKGMKTTAADPYQSEFNRFYFDYLTLPLLFRVTGGSKFQYFINAGPYVGYLWRQTTVTYQYGQEHKLDNAENRSKWDYGISAGLGLAVPITKQFAFSFEVRHNFGLYDVNVLSIYESGRANMNSTNFLAGIIYKFGSRDKQN